MRTNEQPSRPIFDRSTLVVFLICFVVGTVAAILLTSAAGEFEVISSLITYVTLILVVCVVVVAFYALQLERRSDRKLDKPRL
jgi:hypothetical protein